MFYQFLQDVYEQYIRDSFQNNSNDIGKYYKSLSKKYLILILKQLKLLTKSNKQYGIDGWVWELNR